MIRKSIAREKVIEKRINLSPDDVHRLSLNITASAYSFVQNNSFKSVAIYMSIKNEVKNGIYH